MIKILIDIVMVLFFICVLSLILCLIRDSLVFSFRMRLLDLVNTDTYDDLMPMYNNGPTREQMFWDWHKWTFNQFYPHAYDFMRYK